MATPSVAGKSKQSKPDPNRGDGPLATAPSDPNSSPAPLSWYESQKRRDWNTFLQYLQNQKPPLTLAGCRDNHVIDFLRYLDQFGKTKVHTTGCLFFGHPNPPAPCPCPLRQAWGSLDALIGRLRSAYEEHGGRPESNPFAGLAVRVYLREVREHQAKAGGTRRYKKRKGKRLTIVTDKTVMASKEQGGNATGTGGDGSDSAAQTTSTTTTSDAIEEAIKSNQERTINLQLMEETIEMRRQPQLDLEVLEKLQDAEKAKRELKQQEYFDTKLANEEHEKDIWGAAASGISSAAASAVGTAAGDGVYKYAKEIINNLSCKVDSEADYDLENNYERLIEQAKKLYACRDDILAQAKTKLVTQVYEAWISRVKMSEEEVRDLETKYKKIKGKNRTWSPRLIGSSVSRTDLSQSMAEKCKKLQNLWVEGKSEIGIVVEKLPERVIIMHGPKSEDKIFLESYVEEILGHLRDKNVKRIGLWGMSGIGKTTIMQSLNNNEDTAKMFDIVIWVTVSKDWNLEKLQHKIADRLKLNMEGITDPNEIAQLICRDLKSKRCLLLLDEVREVLDLPLIGMCESEKDSKVVVASRNYHVCCDMETDLEIDVKRLSEADAWKMFKVKVGRNVNLPGIEPIAKLVVSECAGLPLLIDKVASMFRRKDNFHLWSDGLRSLRRWPSIKIQGIDELIEYLKFCYEDLDDEVKKACFLYGAIYPEDYEIYKDYLLECWRAEGFIHDTSEFRVARDKGHSILEELISISLLEKSAKMNHVRMNKVIRNMALNISSRSCNFKILVKPREGLQEAPNEVEWQQANRISLMDNKLCTLPEMPDCNELSTLLLQRNQDLIVIPETFFGCMQNLRVLDLHGTGITSLPSSISCLKRLKALYLHSCSCLMELRYLEGLEHLEVLDIRDTSLNHFPIQIGRLNQLKCLRMSLSNFGIRHSSNIEYCRSVFSSLLLLEELLIDVDPNNQSWEVTMKTISEGVAKLTHLTSLSICFPTVDCLKSFISTSQLWKDFRFTFQFSVGYHDTTLYKILDCFEYQIRKCLKFANGEGVDPIISDVLLETDAFELIGHKGTSRLSDFGIESINKMRGCLIEGCNEIETIVDGNRVKRSALTCLEKMFINNVPNLKSIWEGPVHNGSLSQLTTLTLCKCLKLKKIFSGGMIKQLSQLQHVKVEDCPEIEEIIAESENNGLKPDALPRLKMLELSNLPRVKSIWTSDSLKWPSLEKIKISMCQMLTKLPFNSENAINLRCIEAHQTWWSALACQDDAIEQRLRSLWFQSPS